MYFWVTYLCMKSLHRKSGHHRCVCCEMTVLSSCKPRPTAFAEMRSWGRNEGPHHLHNRAQYSCVDVSFWLPQEVPVRALHLSLTERTDPKLKQLKPTLLITRFQSTEKALHYTCGMTHMMYKRRMEGSDDYRQHEIRYWSLDSTPRSPFLTLCVVFRK